jgi:dCMP deaminase
MEFVRPSWDEYFMTIAHLTSQRSNCLRRRVGCILVNDNRILSLGYNGTPRGTKNCYEGGCDRCKNTGTAGTSLDICMCLHAEENALFFVAKNDLKNANMYVTLLPCISCAKKIIQCGIKRVIYTEHYTQELDEMCIRVFKENGIEVEQIKIEKNRSMR